MKRRRNVNPRVRRPLSLAAQLLISALVIALMTLLVLKGTDAIERLDAPADGMEESVPEMPDTTVAP